MRFYYSVPNMEYATAPLLWLRKRGVHIPTSFLFSYAYHNKTTLLPTLEKELGAGPVDMVLDSGAFTVKWTGGTITRSEYAEWVKKQIVRAKGQLYFYLNLDVIGDAGKTEQNQVLLEMSGLSPLPVYHLSSSEDALKRITERYSHFGVGGLRQFAGRDLHHRLNRLFTLAEGKRIHGLAFTRVALLSRYPFDSVDSSSWLSAPRYGVFTIYNQDKRKLEQFNIGAHGASVVGGFSRVYGNITTLGEMRSLWLKRNAEWRAASAALGMYSYYRAMKDIFK